MAFVSWLTVVNRQLNIDEPFVEEHHKQHNRLDLSLGCLGAAMPGSININHATG